VGNNNVVNTATTRVSENRSLVSLFRDTEHLTNQSTTGLWKKGNIPNIIIPNLTEISDNTSLYDSFSILRYPLHQNDRKIEEDLN
jgi:hypothetical protein